MNPEKGPGHAGITEGEPGYAVSLSERRSSRPLFFATTDAGPARSTPPDPPPLSTVSAPQDLRREMCGSLPGTRGGCGGSGGVRAGCACSLRRIILCSPLPGPSPCTPSDPCMPSRARPDNRRAGPGRSHGCARGRLPCGARPGLRPGAARPHPSGTICGAGVRFWSPDRTYAVAGQTRNQKNHAFRDQKIIFFKNIISTKIDT